MALPKTSILKINAMLVITLVHFGLLYLLYHLHPISPTNTYLSKQKQLEQITQISFITRPKKSTPLNTVPKAITKQERVENMQIDMVEKKSKNSNSAESLAIESAPLNLSLPEPRIDFSPKPRNIFERPRNTVEYQSTRFNNAYKPSGNAVDSLKWKSKTFNFITGILGGNQKICTDEDRRNRLPECVPDAYKPED